MLFLGGGIVLFQAETGTFFERYVAGRVVNSCQWWTSFATSTLSDFAALNRKSPMVDGFRWFSTVSGGGVRLNLVENGIDRHDVGSDSACPVLYCDMAYLKCS